ncbi:hypothetical protein ASD11_16080 [Aeromicrobium sp. Root495]|nr:hypothetical protein ASD11_16080 [Aeromicrobium sp. Root495]
MTFGLPTMVGMADEVVLRDGTIRLAVSSHGAEPQSLRAPDGTELLWGGGAPWKRHAPVLFPIICRVPEDSVVVAGDRYPMPQHGLARDHDFQVIEVGGDRATYVLRTDSTTLDHYPYDFTLAVAYTVADGTVTITYDVENNGPSEMPYSLGWHPAFRWPLGEEGEHVITFDEREPAPFRRVADNLLAPQEHESVVIDRRLVVRRELFDDGAVIMTDVRSRGLEYRSPDGHGLRMEWEGFGGITVWTTGPDKPGDLLCIEPWAGSPAPADFSGELVDHPGTAVLAPGARARHVVRVTPFRVETD